MHPSEEEMPEPSSTRQAITPPSRSPCLTVGLLSLAVAACAFASAGCAAQSRQPDTPFEAPHIAYPGDSIVTPDDGYLYEVERIAPHVYAIQSPEPFHYQPLGNVTAIEQHDGFVLI